MKMLAVSCVCIINKVPLYTHLEHSDSSFHLQVAVPDLQHFDICIDFQHIISEHDHVNFSKYFRVQYLDTYIQYEYPSPSNIGICRYLHQGV